MISFKCGIKYLYRPIIFVNNGISTIDYVRFSNGSRHYLSVDYPALFGYIVRSNSIRIQHCNDIVLHMFKDRYNNVIVRYFQLKK